MSSCWALFDDKSSDFLRNNVLIVQEKWKNDGGFNFYRYFCRAKGDLGGGKMHNEQI
jgi:hypothetical protein